MSLIQILLVSGLLAAAALYFIALRSVIFDRLIVIFFVTAGVIAVLFPSTTTLVANYLGVGRGTDLVFYLFACGSVFVSIFLYSKIVQTEQRQTELIRNMAIDRVRKPDSSGMESTR